MPTPLIDGLLIDEAIGRHDAAARGLALAWVDGYEDVVVWERFGWDLAAFALVQVARLE